MTYEEIMTKHYEQQRLHDEMRLKWEDDQRKMAALNSLVQMHIAMLGATMYMGLNPNLFRKER